MSDEKSNRNESVENISDFALESAASELASSEKKRKKLGFVAAAFFVALTLAAIVSTRLGGSGTPPPLGEIVDVDKLPVIYPDYLETTFPVNIAPPNFRIEEDGDRFWTRVSGSVGGESTISGRDVRFPMQKWRRLAEQNAGGRLEIEIYVRKNGVWSKYRTFGVGVSPDRIDPFVAYRLIEPGYEFGRRIELAQRSLETYRESIFFDNRASATSPCVNCHSFQNRQTDRFLFHFRRSDAPQESGTIVVENGEARKVDARLEAAAVSCSYPAWRPTGDLVVFSANKTRQYFHSLSSQKIEVYDFFSDLVLYDAKTDELTPISQTDADFETFPTWAPDGKNLYFCSARVELEAFSPENATLDEAAKTKKLEDEAKLRTKDFRYNIMRATFDEKTRTFGPTETVVDAASRGRSALHPRVSPDGRFLAYTQIESGTFPIWRPEADLYLLDLATGETRPWDEVNGENADSYHTWDSSGRWLVLSSRREDGQYTRLYFAHVDENGRATKPFALPQKDPTSDRRRFKSYNIPELIAEPIDVDVRELTRAAAETATRRTAP